MTSQDATPPATQVEPMLRDRSRSLFSILFTVAAVVGVACAVRGDSPAIGPDSFRAMITGAVARMHVAMGVPFSGDADRDFARMMIPHHQGAIDMALAELRYGKDKRLVRLAQEIIVDQQQEIAVMHLALGDSLPPGSTAPTKAVTSGGHPVP